MKTAGGKLPLFLFVGVAGDGSGNFIKVEGVHAGGAKISAAICVNAVFAGRTTPFALKKREHCSLLARGHYNRSRRLSEECDHRSSHRHRDMKRSGIAGDEAVTVFQGQM
jgi:hypothetical protein